MSNATTTDRPQRLIAKELVVTWNTKKTDKGFSFSVSLIGYQVKTETLKTVDGYRSRAIAKSRAQQWMRYFSACQRQGLLADKF